MARPGASLQIQAPRTLNVSLLCGAALAPFTAATLKLRMPQTGQIIGITLNVGQRGGTHATSTVDVRNGATSLLGAVFDVAALTPATPVDKEGANLAAAAASVAKDATINVVVAVSGGSSPTWADVTLQIDYIPLGD
jgi:hypothetical protein